MNEPRTPEPPALVGQPSEEDLLKKQLREGRLALGVFIYGAENFLQGEASKPQMLEVQFRALCRALAAGCFDTVTTSPHVGDTGAIRRLRQEASLVTHYIALAGDHTVQLLELGVDRKGYGAAMKALKMDATQEGAFTPWLLEEPPPGDPSGLPAQQPQEPSRSRRPGKTRSVEAGPRRTKETSK